MDQSQQDQEQFPTIRLLSETQPKPIVDVFSATVTYRGYASLGTLTSAPGWKIERDTIVGNITTTEYADGNMFFDNVWNNRNTTIQYSR